MGEKLYEKIFHKGDKGKNQKPKNLIGILISIAIIGICLVVLSPKTSIPKMDTSKVVEANTHQATNSLSYEEKLERRLINILKKMEGVGQVQVMVTTNEDEEKVLAEETVERTEKINEKSGEQAARVVDNQDKTNKILIQGVNTPFVVKKIKPDIIGVLVLAEGAEDSTVKAAITEAVAALLDVPVHKVCVFKKGL